MTPFESAPFTSFHKKVTFLSGFGQFADAFSLGAIVIAVNLAKGPLHLTNWWMGAIAAASLAGIFVGSLIAGSVADRFGRRPIFVWDMLLFAVFAVLQFNSSSAIELFAIRLMLGVVLGADYVAGKTLITEFSPSRIRGSLLSFLGVAWAAGYVSSYVVGYLLRESGPEAWRYILLSSAVPSLIGFLIRFRIPESPLWLMRSGQFDKARNIIDKHIGKDIALPTTGTLEITEVKTAPTFLKAPFLRYLIFGCVLQSSFVIPFYALGTFLPMVMSKLGVADGYTGALIFNLTNMLGALVGMFIIDRVSRRTLLIRGFIIMAILLGALIVWRMPPGFVIISLFAAFAFVVSSVGNLQYVYPPELFPTDLRARGIGTITAVSRIGSATSTFFLPVVVEQYGVQTALGVCMAVMITATILCYKWAPETLRKRLE